LPEICQKTATMTNRFVQNLKIILKPVLLISFIITIVCNGNVFSNSDSLNKVFYSDNGLSIDKKINLAKTLSQLYSKSDLEMALECNLALFHYSKIKNNNVEIRTALNKIWLIQNQLANYQYADTTLTLILEQSKPLGNNGEIGEIMFNIGTNYFDWSNYAEANKYFEKAQLHFTLDADKLGMAKSMKRSAIVVSSWGDYEKAIGLMQNARDIYREIRDEKGLAGIQLNLGVIMQEWNKLDRALEYYKQALRYYRNHRLKANEVDLLLHIGDVYLLSNKYKLAIFYYRKAQSLETSLDNLKLRKRVLSSIGEGYFYQNQLDSALFYQKESLKLKSELGDDKETANSYWVLGNIYLKQNYSDSSLVYLGKSLFISRKNGYRDIELDALKSLSENYFLKSNLFQAYNYLKEYQEVYNHTFSDKSNKLLEELSIKYRSDKAEKENEILKQKNDIQLLQIEKERNSRFFTIIFASFIVFIAFVIVFFVNYRIKESRKNLSLLTYKNKEITKQKEKLSVLNEELALSREKFRGIIENATIGIYQTNPEGEVIFANKKLMKTLGFDVIESLKQVNLNDEYPNRKKFLDLMTEHTIITGREDIWKKADGSKMYVMESAWLVKNTDGSIKYIEGLVEDITARKEVELELENSQYNLNETNIALQTKNAQLEKAQQETENAYKAKSSFLANVSHEIRTPMNSIIGFTELLLNIENDEKKVSYISAIDSSSKSLLALITDILDLSKIQAGKFDLVYEPTSIRSILTEMEQIFSLQIEKKKLKFNINIDDNLPSYLSLDGVKIRQVLFNIVGNAIKFTDKGSIRVFVNVNNYNLKNDTVNLEIIVADSGMGISSKDQSVIFSAFSQSSNVFTKSNNGTGLGLSIAKQIVELMNGELQLISVLGEGSTFTITIPNISEIKVRTSKIVTTGRQTIVQKYKSETYQTQEEINFDFSQISIQTRKEINSVFQSDFVKMLNSRMIEDISRFSRNLEEFSKQNNVEVLFLVSSKLNNACGKFEIDNIESILEILDSSLFH
jgi:PAS domain S-box-containing protein